MSQSSTTSEPSDESDPQDSTPYAIPHWAKFKVLAYIAPKGALFQLGMRRRERLCSEEQLQALRATLEDPARREACIRSLEIDALRIFDKISGTFTRSYTLGYRGPNTEREELVAFCSTSPVNEYRQSVLSFWVENAKPHEKIPGLLRVGAMLGHRTSDGWTPKPKWYIPDEACNDLMRTKREVTPERWQEILRKVELQKKKRSRPQAEPALHQRVAQLKIEPR